VKHVSANRGADKVCHPRRHGGHFLVIAGQLLKGPQMQMTVPYTLISVFIVIVVVGIPAVYIVNKLPIADRAKNIVGAIVSIIVIVIAVFTLLRSTGKF
jgi:hypothetical protein